MDLRASRCRGRDVACASASRDSERMGGRPPSRRLVRTTTSRAGETAASWQGAVLRTAWRARSGATAGFLCPDLHDKESGWTILVLDQERREVARGEGPRKQDAWERWEERLKELGLLR